MWPYARQFVNSVPTYSHLNWLILLPKVVSSLYAWLNELLLPPAVHCGIPVEMLIVYPLLCMFPNCRANVPHSFLPATQLLNFFPLQHYLLLDIRQRHHNSSLNGYTGVLTEIWSWWIRWWALRHLSGGRRKKSGEDESYNARSEMA